MSDPTPTPIPAFGPQELDPSATARSLRFLLQSTARSNAAAAQMPMAHLKQRLEQPDGSAWLQASFARPPFPPIEDAGRALLDGSLPLERLRSLKDRAKAGFASQLALDIRIASVAAYFLAIAAALHHHRTCITSQPLADLRTLLIDFASAAEEPWSSFLSSAAFAEPRG